MATETLERSLREHPFVADLGEDQVRFLLGCTKNARFKAGEYLAREGDTARVLFLIRTGRVALENHDPSRGPLVVETLEPGEAMGWSALFPPYEWNVDARALEPTLTFVIDSVCLRGKVDADHSFGYAIMRRLLQEMHGRLVRSRLQQLDLFRGDASR